MSKSTAMFPSFARPMQAHEADQVDALLRAAFDGAEEAALVARLRKQGAIAGEVVLPLGDEVIGYYALAQMVAPKGWLCLAPVAIRPDWQRKKHGKRMIGQLVAWAEAAGPTLVVLGQPAFYEAAGFSSAAAQNLKTPYDAAFTLLAASAEGAPQETLVYPPAFGGN